MLRPADRDQLDRLVVEQIPAALAFALRLTGDADEAEDFVQEALAKVLKNWRRYRGEAQFSTWMLGIVLNVARDRRRRRPSPEPLTFDLADGRPRSDEYYDARELAQRVRQAIDQLPERQRDVALLCLVERLPPAEVATLLETTAANVHTTLHHVRKKLLPLVDFARTPDE
jgi:RNA polymerase sigma-70 factor (ECF subfamily)